jgi:hypothetical protein
MSSLILKSLIATAMLVTAPSLALAKSAPTTELKYDAKTRKYCLIDPAVTGSRLVHKTCKSATQWSADGLDMPSKTLVKTETANTTIAQN